MVPGVSTCRFKKHACYFNKQYIMEDRNIIECQGRKKYPTFNKRRKANWIAHILRSNCLLKHVTEGDMMTK